jgi:predicted amidohydrolase
MNQSRVAAIQMVSSTDVSTNLLQASRLIAAAAAGGARLVVLPENFAYLGGENAETPAVAEPYGYGRIQDFVASQAQQHRIWIAAGTIPLQCDQPNKVRAALLLFSAAGEPAARYDKIHLFDVTVVGKESKQYTESRIIEAGDQAILADTPVGRIGLAVCYDLRFPELFRTLIKKGMELLVLPAAFTAVTGRAHWEVLLRARAIENLCYVVAAAQGGSHESGRETHGESMIVDPWGTVLTRLAMGPGVIIQDVNLERMRAIRCQFPVLDHIRFPVGET